MLLAAVGRSTRSIAEEVGIQPRIVSNWWRRFAEPGLGWLKGRSAGEQHADLRKATNQRIWRLLDKPAPVGYARWMGRCWPGTWAMSVWRFLREHNIAPAGRKSWRQNCRRWSAAMSIPHRWRATVSVIGTAKLLSVHRLLASFDLEPDADL